MPLNFDVGSTLINETLRRIHLSYDSSTNRERERERHSSLLRVDVKISRLDREKYSHPLLRIDAVKNILGEDPR